MTEKLSAEQQQENVTPIAEIKTNTDASLALTALLAIEKTVKRLNDEHQERIRSVENAATGLRENLKKFMVGLYADHGKQAIALKHGQLTYKANPPRIELVEDTNLEAHASNPFVVTKVTYSLNKRGLLKVPAEELPVFVRRVSGEMSFSYKANDEEIEGSPVIK